MTISEEASLLQMDNAIINKDFESFQRIVNNSPHMWTPEKLTFHASPETTLKITILHKLALADFCEALDLYIKNNWNSIPLWNVQYALQCATKKKRKAAVSVLLKAAIAEKPAFLSDREIYFFALRSVNNEIAQQLVQSATFDVNTPIASINFTNVDMWHVPLHNAVAFHEMKTAEVLLLRGAKVDSLSNCGISPMIVACNLVYPTIVALLLRHGSNPNDPRDFIVTPEIRLCVKKLSRSLKKDRGTAAMNESVPLETGPSRTQSLVDKSNYLLQLLLDAGLAGPIQSSFVMRTAAYRHLSPEMKQRLKNLPCEIRSLRSLALAQLRNDIGQKCDGIQYFSTVQNMSIPVWVKDMLTLKSR